MRSFLKGYEMAADPKLPALLPPHRVIDQPLPDGDEMDLLCGRVLALAARGKTLHAACRAVRIPYKTVTNWASQPGASKLRDAIGQIPDLVRGFFEDEMRRNTGNKNYNTALAGKLLGANYDEYRSIAQPIAPNLPEKPEGMSDFEFERRLMAAIEKIVAARDGDAAQLPAKTIDHDPEEKFH